MQDAVGTDLAEVGKADGPRAVPVVLRCLCAVFATDRDSAALDTA
jgi:hypothetical protein